MEQRPLLSATDIIRNAQRKITADINENARRTEQLTKFCEDYTRLDTTLATLADQTSYPLMARPRPHLALVLTLAVPLGPLAFMPGRAVHTNEVFVLLGENYFVERSTKQAREIIDRRLTVLKEEVKTLNEEYDAMRGRLGMTEEMQQGHEALGVGNVVDIREEYNSDDEDDERSRGGKSSADRPAPRPVRASAATGADDVEEEKRMERLMQLLALEEEEELRGKASSGEPTKVTDQLAEASEPHGTKRPKSCLKGDSLDHVNKSVRIMAPGETEAKPPSAYPQQQPPIATGFNSAFTGAIVERAVDPTPSVDSLFALGYQAPQQPPVSMPVPMPTSAAPLHHAPLPIVPMAAMPPSMLATSPVGPSSFAYAMAPSQQQQPQQQQQYYQQPSLLTLNDGSGIVSLTVLGSGTGPAHTIPVMPQQLQQMQPIQHQQQMPMSLPQHHIGSPSAPMPYTVPAPSPVMEQHGQMLPPSPSQSTATTATTTHKRAFSDSPVVERRVSLGGGGVDPFSPIGLAPSVVERPSVVGSAFSGTILEREPVPLSPQTKEEDAVVQPPKKMSRFRAMRGDQS